MKTFITGLIIMISPLLSLAHNPLSARYHFVAGEHASLLTINLSQAGVNQVLSKKYDQEELATANQKQFEELIVDYVKRNFSLTIDQKPFELEQGGIKRGSHQTDLRFVLPPVTTKADRIDIDIPAFRENGNHQTIFSFEIFGEKDKVILNSSNNNQSVIYPHNTSSLDGLWWVPLGGALIIIAGLFSFSTKESL